MNLYQLDLSKLVSNNLPKEVLDFKLTLRDGEYGMDFDLIECDVPKDIYLQMTVGINEIQQDKPLGFNMNTLPAGAIVTKISKG